MISGVKGTVNASMPVEEVAALNDLAQRLGISRSALIRQAVRALIQSEERKAAKKR